LSFSSSSSVSSHPLAVYGWDDAWADEFAPYEPEGLLAGRVVRVDRGQCDVVTADGLVRADTAFVTPHDPMRVVCTGDWVAVEPAGNPRYVRTYLPRRTAFVRSTSSKRSEGQILAANVDHAIVAVSLAVDVDLGRIERFLSLAWGEGRLIQRGCGAGMIGRDMVATGQVRQDVPFGVPTHRQADPRWGCTGCKRRCASTAPRICCGRARTRWPYFAIGHRDPGSCRLADKHRHGAGAYAFPAGRRRRNGVVHSGFCRSTRATLDEVVAELLNPAPEVLYITGHSLGGAMAAMAAVMLRMDPRYAQLKDTLRAVYSYGQPMIGDAVFAEECQEDPFLATKVYRHVHRHDIVPHLPPVVSGSFTHFGTEFRFLDGPPRPGGAQRELA
jgi:hypothetical protein